jgi:hypothetical protein
MRITDPNALTRRALDRRLTNAADQRLRRFIRKHTDRLTQYGDEIYALPKSLIDAIKRQIPNFFTPNDEEFERDLTETTGAGLFLGGPLVHPALPRRPFSADKSELLRLYDEHPVSQAISRLGMEQLRQDGMSATGIATYLAQRERLKSQTAERQIAYAGWLTSQKAFQIDRIGFLRKWSKTIKKRGQFPEVPRSILGERPPRVPKREQNYYASFMMFYQKWGIRSFASWELPIPLAPELDGPSLDHIPSISGAGLSIFIPWYLLRDKHIRLDDVTDLKRISVPPKHLTEWLDKRPKNWGYDRYALMLRLYVYRECCLIRRYQRQTRGNMSALDRALGAFLCNRPGSAVVEETVRKVRQELQRRLGPLSSTSWRQVIDSLPVD